MRHISVAFSCWVSFSLAGAAAIDVPEKRIALVIGNANYLGEPLRNPVNDARLLRTTLTSLGFEVIERTDLDAEGMKTAFQDFGARLRETPGSVGLFYFAGHGVQFKGVNYLLPIGRGYSSEAEVETAAINADVVLRRIADSGSKIAFVVLDACRNNPFPRVASRGLATLVGLARMDAPSGTLIAYSTAMGSVASDGEGSNGLYTQHLVNNMIVPGITAEQMFKRTREGVERESGNLQSPREESSLKGADFLFLPASEGKKVNPYLVELTHWESIRSSQDFGDFEAYLHKLPASKKPTIVIPSYNGARKLPVLTPLLALLLAREGLPVLVHGTATESRRVYTSEVLLALSIPAQEAIESIAAGKVAFVPTSLLHSGLQRLLDVRRVVGLRNTAHSLVKLMNPVLGKSLLVTSYTHPEYAVSMAETLALLGGNALLLRGTEGEAVADARRTPTMQGFVSGSVVDYQEPQHGSLTSLPNLPNAIDADSTAAYIRQVMDGAEPVPAPIAQQVAHILHLVQAL
jgi:hypothetical protein